MSERDKQARTEDAAAWLVRISADTASPADWTAFTAWLEADPLNRQAFDRVEGVDAKIDALAPEFTARVERLDSGIGRTRVAMHGPRAWIAGAGLLAAAALVLVFMIPGAPDAVTFSIAAGEMRPVHLADGSEIDINAKSEIVLTKGVAGRRVTLVSGEALFHVAKDPTRPFVVTVGDRAVRVVGTVFDVRRDSGMIQVTVAQGKVAVAPHGPNARAQRVEMLLPGDELIYDESRAALTRQRVDPGRVMSWRNGYLVYENASLDQIAADINRTFSRPVTVEGDAARQRFSGALKMDNEDAVLDRLSKLLPVRAVRNPDGTVTLRPSKNRD
jgi:transmembrane sensor